MKTTTPLTLLCVLLLTACNKDTSTSQPVESQTATSTSTSTTTGGTGTTTGSTTGGSTSSQNFTTDFMDLLNAHREGMGLSQLILDDEVSKIVIQHSQNMANGTTPFGHTGFSTRCAAASAILGNTNLCAENVAMGQKTPQAAFTAWLNSPGHRANMENSRVNHTGFGFAQSSSGTYYWTQIFIEVR